MLPVEAFQVKLTTWLSSSALKFAGTLGGEVSGLAAVLPLPLAVDPVLDLEPLLPELPELPEVPLDPLLPLPGEVEPGGVVVTGGVLEPGGGLLGGGPTVTVMVAEVVLRAELKQLTL